MTRYFDFDLVTSILNAALFTWATTRASGGIALMCGVSACFWFGAFVLHLLSAVDGSVR